MIAIGTVASELRKTINHERFEFGLRQLVNTKHPKTLIVIGTINVPVFKELSETNIEIIHFRSTTDLNLEAYRNVKR